MSTSRDARIAAVLACPVCKLPLQIKGNYATCSGCGRRYDRLAGAWRLQGDDSEIALPQHLCSRFAGRAGAYSGTVWSRLYRRVYVHPARFIGDLQHTGLTNFHRRLAAFVQSFAPSGLLLDLGSGSRRLGPDVMTLDIAPLANVDIVGDGHRLPLQSGSLDGLIIQQVLEHVRDPAQVIHEARRVLKSGGRIYCEVPFLYPIHDRLDFHRWSITGLEMLCAPFSRVDAGMSMGPLSAFSAIVRRMATTPLKSAWSEAAIDLVLGWVLSPLKYLDELMIRWPAATLVAGAVYFEGRKRET